MTNKEALVAEIQTDLPADNTLVKALMDAGLMGGDQYTPDNASKLGKAAVDVLSGLLFGSVSEGGLTLSFDRKAVEARLSYLSGKYQISGYGPTITSIKPW